jgi:hypothetical protein
VPLVSAVKNCFKISGHIEKFVWNPTWDLIIKKKKVLWFQYF